MTLQNVPPRGSSDSTRHLLCTQALHIVPTPPKGRGLRERRGGGREGERGKERERREGRVEGGGE